MSTSLHWVAPYHHYRMPLSLMLIIIFTCGSFDFLYCESVDCSCGCFDKSACLYFVYNFVTRVVECNGWGGWCGVAETRWEKWPLMQAATVRSLAHFIAWWNTLEQQNCQQKQRQLTELLAFVDVCPVWTNEPLAGLRWWHSSPNAPLHKTGRNAVNKNRLLSHSPRKRLRRDLSFHFSIAYLP